MGENKGHGIKGPRHDDDVDDLTINTASGKIAPGGQQQSGNMHPGPQDGMKAGQQPGNLQSEQAGISQGGGQQQQGSQQQGGSQQGSQQSGQQQGSMQSGQQGNQQHGGQHASGGTPALDDLGSRQGESAKEASQAWSQDSGTQERGNR